MKERSVIGMGRWEWGRGLKDLEEEEAQGYRKELMQRNKRVIGMEEGRRGGQKSNGWTKEEKCKRRCGNKKKSQRSMRMRERI